jgi:hypothetical protein
MSDLRPQCFKAGIARDETVSRARPRIHSNKFSPRNKTFERDHSVFNVVADATAD